MATLHLAAGYVATRTDWIFNGMNEVQPNQACDGAARAPDCALLVSGSQPPHEINQSLRLLIYLLMYALM